MPPHAGTTATDNALLTGFTPLPFTESTTVTQGARDLILQQFDSLSPQLQAAARFVVDHPNDVLIRSMRHVADLAGVPPSTLVRLARQLGYDGWPALKDNFAHALGLDHPQGYADRAQRLTGQAHTHPLADELFDAHSANLERTRQHSAPVLVPLAQCLQSAHQVFVAGFRASYPLAFALQYGYRLFRDSVHAVDGHAHNLEMQLRPVGAADVLVAISFAPYSRECLEVARIAQERGARIVALTDSEASPLARMADHAALFAVDSPSFFPSVAAGMALVEALLEQLVALGDVELPQRIQKAESALVESGAYVQGRQALKAFRHR